LKLEERPSEKKELGGAVTWLEGTKGRWIYRWGVVKGEGRRVYPDTFEANGSRYGGGRCKENRRKIARAKLSS